MWSVLYFLIALSFGTVFYRAYLGLLPVSIAYPFLLNLTANFAFSPLQFRLRSNVLAAIDILLVLGSLVWAIVAVAPFAPWIAWMQVPYLLWVSFATVLQLTVTRLNA